MATVQLQVEQNTTYSDDLNAKILKLNTELRESRDEYQKVLKFMASIKGTQVPEGSSSFDQTAHGPGKCVSVDYYNSAMSEMEDHCVAHLDKLIEQNRQTDLYLQQANEENAELLLECTELKQENLD